MVLGLIERDGLPEPVGCWKDGGAAQLFRGQLAGDCSGSCKHHVLGHSTGPAGDAAQAYACRKI